MKLLQIGDVITSPAFSDRISRVGVKSYQINKYDLIKKSASRGTAKWLVVEAEFAGGGRAQSMDVYPDVWHVTVQRLNPNNTYNPMGEKITFVQDAHYYSSNLENFTVVGHMERTVTIKFGKLIKNEH